MLPVYLGNIETQ
jgi:hypothetical protein